MPFRLFAFASEKPTNESLRAFAADFDGEIAAPIPNRLDDEIDQKHGAMMAYPSPPGRRTVCVVSWARRGYTGKGSPAFVGTQKSPSLQDGRKPLE